MKPKFKVGDRVVCIDDRLRALFPHLTKNKIYTIIDGKFEDIGVINDNGVIAGYDSDRFKLVSDFKTKLKFVKELI